MSSNNSPNTSSVVSKVWVLCNTFRDDGVGYGDCLKKDLQDSKISRIGNNLKFCKSFNQFILDSDKKNSR